MAPRRSLLTAAVVAFAVAAALVRPEPAAATNPWTLALSPTTLTEGVATNVTLTVTDGSELIGCIVVAVPAGFTVLGADVSSVPTPGSWSATVSGGSPTSVTFHSSTDLARLNGGVQAVFVIRVVAGAGPLPPWTAVAYKGTTVDSTQLGAPLAPPVPFTIDGPATPTPAPTATPVPSPTPVAATASPGPPATPRPTATPTSTPPPAATATPAPAVAQSPSASPEPSDTPAPEATQGPGQVVAVGSTAVPTARAGGIVFPGDDGGTRLDIQGLPQGGTVQLSGEATGGMGMFAWAVPALFLALPGLLLILIVLAQAAFATVFVPVTRRVLHPDRRRGSRSQAAPRI
jgi:hypothetical protein